MKRASILMKYLVFILGCGLVLAGLTSYFYNPTNEQIVFSALATILGALLVTLGLTKPPQITKSTEHETELDQHNEFHSPSDVMGEDEKHD